MNKRYWAAIMAIPTMLGFCTVSNTLANGSTRFTVNVTDASLELDVPASPVVLTLNPTATGANFGSVDLTAIVGTNNPAGYTLSVTFGPDTSLHRTTAVNGTTPSISTLDTLEGGYAEADFTTNRWGHKITGDNYFPIPSETLSPESWASDGPVNNAENTMTLAAKADGTIPSGIYENTLTYTVVANVVEPDPDDPDPVDPDPDTTTFDEAFAAAEKVKDATSGKYKMQDMNSTICSAVTKEQTTTLVDSRDGTIYNVGKLVDNKCWLLDNLALDLLAQDASTKITADNTNADATSLNALFNGGRDAATNPDGNLPTAGVANWTSSWSYSAPLVNMASKDVEPTYDEDGSADEPLASEVRAGHWKVGGYYNYCAASAGSYCYGNGTSAGSSATGNASSDICPAGWRMPTGGADGEYQLLANAITGGTSDWINTEPEYSNIRKALSLPLSGAFYGGSSLNQGSSGYFWSSTYYNSDNMYGLYAGTSSIYPQNVDRRYRGYSVRCIAQ